MDFDKLEHQMHVIRLEARLAELDKSMEHLDWLEQAAEKNELLLVVAGEGTQHIYSPLILEMVWAARERIEPEASACRTQLNSGKIFKAKRK